MKIECVYPESCKASGGGLEAPMAELSGDPRNITIIDDDGTRLTLDTLLKSWGSAAEELAIANAEIERKEASYIRLRGVVRRQEESIRLMQSVQAVNITLSPEHIVEKAASGAMRIYPKGSK